MFSAFFGSLTESAMRAPGSPAAAMFLGKQLNNRCELRWSAEMWMFGCKWSDATSLVRWAQRTWRASIYYSNIYRDVLSPGVWSCYANKCIEATKLHVLGLDFFNLATCIEFIVYLSTLSLHDIHQFIAHTYELWLVSFLICIVIVRVRRSASPLIL